MFLAISALSLAAIVQEPALAFVGVDVLPMDRDVVLEDHTVIVQGERIVALGPAKEIAIPDGAQRIDGKGRTLMPGLADMHVHSYDPNDLTVFVANGVTTIRNMFGSPLHLAWREKTASGELFGPAVVTAGPIVDGNPPVWPGSTVLEDAARAEEVVLEQKKAGYDFVKVYAKLPLDAYEALVVAAREHGMPVMGHVPRAVGLERVVAAKQRSIEHLDGLAAFAQPEDSPYRGKLSFLDEAQAWKRAEDARIARAAGSFVASGVWSCPTLVVMQKWVPEDEVPAMLARPEMRYVGPMSRWFWKSDNNYLKKLTNEDFEAVRAADADRKRAVRVLHGKGARILLGTDMGNPYVVAGFALHEELANLVAAGMSPFEALRAGTHGAAEFLGATNEWGSVAVGRRADLLLLEANPLEDVANATKRTGVMLRGRWLPEEELRGKLEALAEKYAGRK